MALRQGLIYGCYDFRVGQNSVGCRHPMIAQIAHFLGDQPSPKLSWARRMSITDLPPPLRGARSRAQQVVIELADRLDALLQLLIVGQPAANLFDPFAAHAE